MLGHGEGLELVDLPRGVHELGLDEGVDADLRSLHLRASLPEFLAVCPKRLCISTVGTRTDLFARDPKKVGVTSTGLCNSQCLIKQVIVENYQTPKIFLVEVFLIPNIITRR